MAVAITGTDLPVRALRAAMPETDDAKVARRIPPLASDLEGFDRKTAAKTCGMDRPMLRDRVHRCN